MALSTQAALPAAAQSCGGVSLPPILQSVQGMAGAKGAKAGEPGSPGEPAAPLAATVDDCSINAELNPAIGLTGTGRAGGDGSGTLLAEYTCGWGGIVGTTTDGTGTQIGYDWQSVTAIVGGQTEVHPGWFLGGSLGYEASSLDGNDEGADVDGQARWVPLACTASWDRCCSRA